MRPPPDNDPRIADSLSSLTRGVRAGDLRTIARAVVQARDERLPLAPLVLHAAWLDARLGLNTSWVLPLAGVVLERLGQGQEEWLLGTLYEGCAHLHRRAPARKTSSETEPADEDTLLQLCADPSAVVHLGSVGAAFTLLDGCGATPAQRTLILGGLRRTITGGASVHGPWHTRLEALDLRALQRAAITGAPAWFDRGKLLHSLLQSPPEACLEAWIHAIQSGVPLPDLGEILVVAASQRMLRFDIAHEFDRTQPLGFGALSRTLELCVALAQRLQEPCGPVAVPLLLAAVWRLSHLGGLDGQAVGLREPASGGIPALERAAFTRNPDHAVALGRGLSRAELLAFLRRESLEERLALPQSRALNLLAVQAAEHGSRLLESGEDRLPLLAALRLLCSPRQESGLGRALAAARE
ncbi:MAG: hypothetical protein VX899_02115 [Myxococcota bacterium]|nr:hypothetical protein [Myxococcota bacterium]